MEPELELSLELRDVWKSYPGFRLAGVSLSLPRGYIMGLLGPNGAGKTTCIRLLLGLARPEAGAVLLFGHEMEGRDSELRRRVGFVHESQGFHGHLSVAAIRSLVAPHYDTWDDAVFRGLTEELGLPLRKRVGTLSKGERSKLAIALALSHHAELLVMDEPTSGLDPAARSRFLRILQERVSDERASVLFSTQITSDLERVADFVAFLRDGELALSGSRDELRERLAVVKGPSEAADELSGPAYHGMRRGEVGFRVLTSDAARTRRSARPGIQVEPATLEDIMEHMGRSGS